MLDSPSYNGPYGLNGKTKIKKKTWQWPLFSVYQSTIKKRWRKLNKFHLKVASASKIAWLAEKSETGKNVEGAKKVGGLDYNKGIYGEARLHMGMSSASGAEGPWFKPQ